MSFVMDSPGFHLFTQENCISQKTFLNTVEKDVEMLLLRLFLFTL